MRGLTSLFGMGRGEHPRENHHKKFRVMNSELRMCIQNSAFIIHNNKIDISGKLGSINIKKLKRTGN